VREQWWMLLGMFGVIVIGMCTATYLTWGDASAETRFYAEVALVAIVGLGLPA
jgi:hypothetical protein